MFDSADPETIHAIRALRDVAVRRERPLILWLGAGTSRWCGYQGWEDLSRSFHTAFWRRETKYEKASAQTALDTKDFPLVFELCKKTNPDLYKRLLVDSFGSPKAPPVFRRLVELLSAIQPAPHVLTTNVDESLEKNCPGMITIQRTDFERIPDLLNQKTPFICKLHGSISSVESTVFASSEYDALLRDENYLRTIENIFSNACVVFVGYGVRDEYVLKALEESTKLRPIFGAGPHFAAIAGAAPWLPSTVRTIRYLVDVNQSHRAALETIDLINRSASIEVSAMAATRHQEEAPSILSAYFIAHFLPPGTWASSQQITAARPDGRQIEVTVGEGFTNHEVPSLASTAMHDLVVGLVCFDVVYLPFQDITKIHDLISSAWFWELVSAGILRFIRGMHTPGIIYPDRLAISGGDLGLIGTPRNDINTEPTVAGEIRSLLLPAQGMEQEAERQFGILEKLVTTVDDRYFRRLPELVRGTLLHPAVQRTLGLSEAFLPTKIPRWNVFPVLRLANLIYVGQVCESLQIPAVRVGFGGEKLLGEAFSVASAQDWADEAASYVVGGQFNTDMGEMVFGTAGLLGAILKFRGTTEGIELRKRIRDSLSVNEGHEFVASVNAGLQRNIPGAVLEAARNQLSALLIPKEGRIGLAGAVWNNSKNSDASVRLWRKRSREVLEYYCRSQKIEIYQSCPCGSGDRLKFCCLRPVSE